MIYKRFKYYAIPCITYTEKDEWQNCQLMDGEDCHHYFIYSETKQVELKREKGKHMTSCPIRLMSCA